MHSNKVIVPSPHSVHVKFSIFCSVTFLTCNCCYINYINWAFELLSKKKKKQFCWGTWCLLIGIVWALWSLLPPASVIIIQKLFIYLCVYCLAMWTETETLQVSALHVEFFKNLMDNVSGFCFHFLWENVSRNCSVRFVATTWHYKHEFCNDNVLALAKEWALVCVCVMITLDLSCKSVFKIKFWIFLSFKSLV